MQKTVVDVQQIKEKFQPVMKDIESRLAKLEKPVDAATEEQVQIMKDRFRPVIQDIERRLISRPTESALSNVSFADEPTPSEQFHYSVLASMTHSVDI